MTREEFKNKMRELIDEYIDTENTEFEDIIDIYEVRTTMYDVNKGKDEVVNFSIAVEIEKV